MRFVTKGVALFALAGLVGCNNHSVPPETPKPPNTILLSQMMRELSAEHPQLVEQMVAEIEKSGKKGPALLTPKLADELRKRILGKDWSGLDRFPGWTMREVNPTVRVVGHFAGKSESLEGASEVHPGAKPATDSATRDFLDVGPYSLDRAETERLDVPSPLPPFTTEGIVTEVGAGVIRGDGPNSLIAPEHAASQRLSNVLNRLAMNRDPGVKAFDIDPSGFGFALGEVTAKGGLAQAIRESRFNSPEDLISALVHSHHEVTVIDARYFANFGHLHYMGQDVMMPFWVNTQIAVPGTGGVFTRPRPLLIPVSHAEYEWQIRGPQINADVSWYFGIDGKAEWRVMDTLDQPWVLKRAAHTYTGAQAVEVTRLVSAMTVAYMHQHARRPKLPFGGYYGLGVCQDGVSAIEKKMTGKVTLFPNTADSSLFDDPRDAEVNAMIAAIPKDRAGAMPEPERVFGSLPTTDFNTITIPGLADDLNATYTAWKDGELKRTHGWLFYTLRTAGLAAAIGIGLAMTWKQRKR